MSLLTRVNDYYDSIHIVGLPDTELICIDCGIDLPTAWHWDGCSLAHDVVKSKRASMWRVLRTIVMGR